MSIGVTFDFDSEAFEEDGRRLSSEFPKATAKAVNNTAAEVLAGLTQVIDLNVNDPTDFTRDAFASTSARPGWEPSATVYVKDEQGEYLRYLFEGGVLVEPGGILVPGSGAKLDRHGNFPAGYLETVEANGGWWMTNRKGLEGLYVRNAWGNVEAIALQTTHVRYEKKADFHAEVAAIVERELPGRLQDAFEVTFGK